MKILELLVLSMTRVFEDVVVQRNLPSPRVANKAKRKVPIVQVRSDGFSNRSGGGMLVSHGRVEDRLRGQFRLGPMADFVGCIVLFEAPPNARSSGFVQMNEDKFLAVRQNHVSFVKRPSEEYDVWSNLTLLCPDMQAPFYKPSIRQIGCHREFK